MKTNRAKPQIKARQADGKMDHHMNLIVLSIITLLVCLGEGKEVISESAKRSDDLSEMFRNVNDIFSLNKEQTSWNSAKFCTDIPQCTCTDLGFAKGLRVDCQGKNLTNIPTNFPLNTTQLVLAMNSISSIPDNIFKNYMNATFLDLSFNMITRLGQNVFTGLTNLKVLNLEMNRIRYINTSIHSEAFKPMTQLTAINLQQNLSDISTDERYQIKALTCLTALQHLAMDGLPNQQFNEQFLKLESLKILHLGGVSRRCNITQVLRNMFDNLPNLTDLTIGGCKLKLVENQSFVEIPKLESLDLSHNEELEFKSFANISYGLQFTNIRKLALIKIHATFGNCTILTAENLEYLYNTSLKYIFLDSNRLSLFETEAVHYIPRSLIGLSLIDNKLMLGKYVIQIAIDIAFHEFFANLKIFLIASQRVNHSFKELFKHMTLKEVLGMLGDHSKQTRLLQYQKQILLKREVKHQQSNLIFSDSGEVSDLRRNTPKIHIQDLGKKLLLKYFGEKCKNCQNTSTGIITLPLPANLTVADLSNLKIRTMIQPMCFCENKLQNLSMDSNTYWYWKGPLLGLNELTHLHLAWNYCERISFDFFHYFPKLQILNISGNFLGFALSSDNDGMIFSKLTKLKVLLMTDNKIKFLPPDIFKGLYALQELNLKSNQLNIINWNTDHMLKLRLVDLSENQIVTIDENVRRHWDRLSSTSSFSIKLTYNSFQCNCKNLDLIKWFSETKVNFIGHHKYKCKFDNGTLGYLVHANTISRSLTKECANYFTAILATSLAILSAMIAMAAGIAYRYRWNLRYMYYSAKFKLKGYSPVNTEEGDFENDVFVSYADEDGTFVRCYLVPELENNRGLNLLVHDRDFRAGNFVNDNIMHAITTSRKTLIIMLTHFLRSKWCCYEMNMARMEGIKTGRDVICIVMVEEVSTSGLPLEILDIIRQKTYLEYPKDDQNHLRQFWDRLADAIKH